MFCMRKASCSKERWIVVSPEAALEHVLPSATVFDTLLVMSDVTKDAKTEDCSFAPPEFCINKSNELLGTSYQRPGLQTFLMCLQMLLRASNTSSLSSMLDCAQADGQPAALSTQQKLLVAQVRTVCMQDHQANEKCAYGLAGSWHQKAAAHQESC